jgi:acetyl-CoA carboxylase biotin carboxyl carrier protein
MVLDILEDPYRMTYLMLGGLMEIKEIRQLIKLVESADISEFEIEEEGRKVRISKNSKPSAETVIMNPAYHPHPPSVAQTELPIQNLPESALPDAATGPAETAVSQYHEVRSPMVGTFYTAPAPDADPYVDVGQNITVGQTLCIIEAMKLMNEIESDFTGKIAKIVVDNAQPVEYNQVLFLIEK